MTSVEVRIREWESVGPGTEIAPTKLRGLRFSTDEARRQAATLTKTGALEIQELRDGLSIRARSHVGRVELGDIGVTILPKIAGHDLLALFRYAYGLKDLKLIGEADYAATGALFQDLLAAQLLSETRRLLERGIARTYVAHNDDLASPRGQIDFGRLMAQRGRASATLPCRHYLRATDHILNRVLLAGVRLVTSIVSDRELRHALRREENLLAELASTVTLNAQMLAQARRSLSRLVAPYESLLTLIEILYFSNLLELEEESGSRRLSGFLFDMNRFFQALIDRFLKENLPLLRVESEYGLTEMLRYVPGHNPRGRKAPTPRPDYAIKKGASVLALLDAKYRDLWDRPLPREMLYQLTVYALSQARGSTAAILYPAIDSTARPSRIEIREPTGGRTAGYVALRPVHISQMAELIRSDDRDAIDARQAMARSLAGVSNRTVAALRIQGDPWPNRTLS